MKNLLIVIATTLLTSNLYPQISVIDNSKYLKIGEVTQAGVPIISLTKIENEYTFRYINNLDQDTNDYKVFKLINKDNDIEQLHSLILKGFKEKKNNLIKIQTHEEVIGLEFIKAVGVMAFRFVQFEEDDTIGYTIALSKRQVNKLFGK